MLPSCLHQGWRLPPSKFRSKTGPTCQPRVAARADVYKGVLGQRVEVAAEVVAVLQAAAGRQEGAAPMFL